MLIHHYILLILALLIFDYNLKSGDFFKSPIINNSIKLPKITQGETNCRGLYTNCSPCVEDVEKSIRTLFESTKREYNYYYLPKEPLWKVKNHIQGIAKLPNSSIFKNPIDQVIITRDRDKNGGLHVVTPIQNAPSIQDESHVKKNPISQEITSLDITDTGLNHPSGIQVIGNILAIAIECSKCYIRSEIRFYEFRRNELPKEVSRLKLEGSLGEPQQERWKSASVAITKLINGKYLLFVAGARHGQEGGWFYLSNNSKISKDTKWEFLQFWEPECIKPQKGCWTGASNMTFLNDCSTSREGNIYLIASHGKASFIGRSENYINVNRITQDSITGKIHIKNVDLLKPKTKGKFLGFGTSYRWAGNIFVQANGKLYSEVSTRDTNSQGRLKTEKIINAE